MNGFACCMRNAFNCVGATIRVIMMQPRLFMFRKQSFVLQNCLREGKLD